MIYTDGTIAIKAGSPIVTGTGTQWKKNIHGVAPGQMVSIENGTNPINMMIRAVNSDTELVLSFNAPVARSGAKYSIATTVPDTISDAARTMSANQGYIVYFLQAMQQWMTDTGRVEIELPNGQKVKLDSVKAMNELLDKKANTSDVSTAVGKKLDKTARTMAAVENVTSWTALFNKLNNGGCSFIRNSSIMTSANPFPVYSTGVYAEAGDTRGVIGIPYSTDPVVVAGRAGPDGGITSRTLWDSLNSKPDANGWLKVSSPIIEIYSGDRFETNDESEGAYVHHTDTGQYHITGILGYNSDGAWGVNGGISVPKDNNGLELVYVADRVLEDGGIIIETCHRQHTHLPDKFQNWRLKEITTAGDRVFYQDGEPCDLPEYTRLDVRVEMPQGSVWNVKQRELAEQMEREQAEREAQEATEKAGEAEE